MAQKWRASSRSNVDTKCDAFRQIVLNLNDWLAEHYDYDQSIALNKSKNE